MAHYLNIRNEKGEQEHFKVNKEVMDYVTHLELCLLSGNPRVKEAFIKKYKE